MRPGLGSRSFTTVGDGAPLFLVRLYLRFACTFRTPVRDTPDVWQFFPFIIRAWSRRKRGLDNIIAEFEHRDRACQIQHGGLSRLHLAKVSVAMQEPFQELTSLDFWPNRSRETMPVPRTNREGLPPDSFLGGSAASMQSLWFYGIPFPGLPNPLSSAAHLVGLHLRDIPQSGYFSPEAMPVLIALSTLTNIRDLSLCFSPPRSCSDRTSLRPPLLAWSDLPFLPH